MTKNIWTWATISILSCIVVGGCADNSTDSDAEDVAQEVIELLVEEEHEQVYNQFFDDELKESMPLLDLIRSWEERTETSGEYVGLYSLYTSERDQAYVVVEADLEYTDVIFPVRMIFGETNQLIGLNMTNGVANATLPESVVEEEVIIGEGTPYELGGTLTLPQQQQEDLPAVVLVHGSGPSDRDESTYAYKPFRDIAWGLAQHDIAVLRYDKRTYTYGNSMSPEELNQFTVHEETVEDALLAAELLKGDPRIDAHTVYVIGHSLGGMLAPRIAKEGEELAGIVILAGSPRSLWEIIYDQNMAVLAAEDIDESTRDEQEQMIQEQWEKAQQMDNLTDEEALSETIFGLPAHYLREMDRYDTEELVTDLEIPILVLQGEDDFQVYMDKDFAMWKKLLQDHENATLTSYPGLNHFFVRYDGSDKGTIAEYEHPEVVDTDVINDMANWIIEQVQ